MPTNLHRVHATISDELWEKLEKYRYENHIMSMSSVVVRLCEIALNAEDDAPAEAPAPLPKDENALLESYRKCNEIGRSVILGAASSCALNPEMQKSDTAPQAM